MNNILRTLLMIIAVGGLLISCNSGEDIKDVRAFPGAEGYGAAAVGGRGGDVYYVTTLEDYNPETEQPIEGSLRQVLNIPGPRNILFKVSGDIKLKTPLFIEEPYITIAGQTSPGGICIRDCEFGANTHDVIIRYMRFRSGEDMQEEYDSFQFNNAYNCILDHCSLSWSTDEVLSATEATSFYNATFQWCIVSEALSESYHPKGEHSMGSLLSGDGGLTIHHCLYANNANRNPRSHYLVLDFRNNIVYNWRSNICYTRNAPNFINMVGNYFKPGPDTPKNRETRAFSPGDDMATIYLSGNEVDGHPDILSDNSSLVELPKNMDPEKLSVIITDKEFEMPYVYTHSAQEAYELILAEAGATLPAKDAVDVRVIDGVRKATGRIIDSPYQVGGYPELPEVNPLEIDTDGDGMPDYWEIMYGLDPNDPSDGKLDSDGDGYTNLEEYLNGTNPLEKEKDLKYDSKKILKLGEIARQMLIDKDKAYKAEQQRLWDEKEVVKEQLKKTTSASFSADPAKKADRISLDVNGKASIDLVLIKAGSFYMGATEKEKGEEIEYPRHKVNISKDFYMATTKVTVDQYCAIYGADSKKMTDSNKKQPAMNVSWYDAVDYCDILSAITGLKFRLPTEAEWEYACRAGTQTIFNTGNAITTDQANFNGKDASEYNPAGVSRGKYTDVDMFPPNPWGLYDMHGNETEFCLDKAFRKYTEEEVTDPYNDDPNSGRYVIRGGKSASKAFFVRSAYRYSYTPDVGYSFRFIVEI